MFDTTMSKNNSSSYTRQQAETCCEWRGLSLRFSAWATQLRRNVAAVASLCQIWPSRGLNPRHPSQIALSSLNTLPTSCVVRSLIIIDLCLVPAKFWLRFVPQTPPNTVFASSFRAGFTWILYKLKPWGLITNKRTRQDYGISFFWRSIIKSFIYLEISPIINH